MLSIEWESAAEDSDVIAGSLGNGRLGVFVRYHLCGGSRLGCQP